MPFFKLFKLDVSDYTVYDVFSWMMLGGFILLLIRMIWVAARNFFGKGNKNLYFRPVLFCLVIVLFGYVNLKVVDFFYTEKQGDLASKIEQFNSEKPFTDTTTDCTLILGVVLTNKSELIRP